MKTRTDEEIGIREELNQELERLHRMIRQMPREKVVYLIIRRFMEADDPSDELKNAFHRWLASPRDAQAKEVALQRCFEEFFEVVCDPKTEYGRKK